MNISKEWILYKTYEDDNYIWYRCISFTTGDTWKKQLGYRTWYYDGYIYTFSFYYFGFATYERDEEKPKYLNFNFN